MLSFPLIARELRIQSRKRGTYDLRTICGLGAFAALWFFASQFPEHAANGTYLFTLIHACLALMLFVIAPIGAADAISREKRDGTLSLLLLTKLTPVQIVLGKIAAHLIRLFYFWVMMLPFIMLPVLMGGVGLNDFFFSMIILFAIAAAGISAGLIASAFCLSFTAAISWAIILATLFTVIAGSSIVNLLFVLLPGGQLAQLPAEVRIFVIGPLTMLLPMQVQDIAGRFIGSRWTVQMIELGLAFFSILFLRFSLGICARQVGRRSEFAGETKRQSAFRRTFLTPLLWRNSFRRSMSRRLDRNPLLWLEYRTAWARAGRWAMFLLVAGFQTQLLINLPNRQAFISLQFILLWILLIFLTFKSSGSFHSEKETGAFELLLVTPLTESKLFSARLLAVANYYGVAVVTFAAWSVIGFLWTETSPYFDFNQLSMAMKMTSLCASFISAPICGLYFAIRCRGFLPALLSTAGLAILAPLCLWMAFNGLIWMGAMRVQPPVNLAVRLQNTLETTWWPAIATMALYHLLIAILCGRATINMLRARQFIANTNG